MAKTKISEFSSTPGNNTDIDGINIAEGCAPSGINDAIRELMSQLKDFQAGTAGDSFNGPVGTTTAAAGAFTTLSASSTVSGTGFSTYLASPPAIGGTAAAAGSFTTLSASSTVTLSGGTANGVAYLNGSKVLTTGSALTFDGSIVSNTGVGFNVNNANALYRFQNGSGTRTGYFQVRADAFEIWSDQAAVPMVFGVANAEQMRLTSTGLGIGTSSLFGILSLQTGTNARFEFTSASTVGSLELLNNARNAYVDYDVYALTHRWKKLGSTAMTLDSSGNLGLGVTPSAWNSTYKVFNFGEGGLLSSRTNASIKNVELGVNWYRTVGGSFVYAANGYGTNYTQQDGVHTWYYAASGTAGNAISFTQAMTLAASGGLSIGTTTDAGTGNLLVAGNISLATNGTSFQWTNSGNNVAINGASGVLSFYTGTSAYNERARITSGGEVYIAGTTDQGAYNLQVNGTGVWGAGAYVNGSDARLKDEVHDLAPALDVVASLRPVTFKYKADYSKDQSIQPGFIAQELQQAMSGQAYVDGVVQSGPEYLNVAYQSLIPLLTKAIQELKAEFDAYKASHP